MPERLRFHSDLRTPDLRNTSPVISLDFLELFVRGEQSRLRLGLHDTRAGRHRFGQPDVAADNTAFTDDRVTAEDGRAGIDDDVIFNRRVAFLPANQTA